MVTEDSEAVMVPTDWEAVLQPSAGNMPCTSTLVCIPGEKTQP